MSRTTILALVACGGPGAGADTAHARHLADSGQGDDTGWVERASQETDGGAFTLAYVPDPDPIPFATPFALVWSVYDPADASAALGDATLALDAAMPGHGHGMNTIPTITAAEDGTLRADGMLFHMRGWWSVTATVTRGDVTDEATFYVECCAE